MPAKTKRRPPKGRQMQHSKQRTAPSPRPWLFYGLAATGLVGLAVAAALLSFRGGGDTSSKKASAGLPNTPDYHSLLINPGDPSKIVLAPTSASMSHPIAASTGDSMHSLATTQ
jgi:hypothetical protein